MLTPGPKDNITQQEEQQHKALLDPRVTFQVKYFLQDICFLIWYKTSQCTSMVLPAELHELKFVPFNSCGGGQWSILPSQTNQLRKTKRIKIERLLILLGPARSLLT